VGAGHAHALHVHGHTAVHHLPPEVKVAGTLAFVGVAALTPASAAPAFAAHGVVLLVVAVVARLRPGGRGSRAAVVLPFLAFIALIPFVASGPRTTVLGLAVSAEGLLAARTLLAKALIGVTASVLLAATTEAPAIVRGLGRLRVPPVLVAIAAFMLRYLEVLLAEVGRVRTAMTARAYDPRWLWQVRPLAHAAGALFIRSYERGERVHAAMLARGYTGVMPVLDGRRAAPAEWVVALLPAAAAATATASAVLLARGGG
jgi:cobalt/nickel transport system permease protein